MISVATCILLHFAAASGHAQTCGLHSVPLSASESAKALVLGADLRSAGLAGAESPGRFSEIAFQARINTEGPWSAGWEWPLAFLRLGGTTRIGFGNPGAFAEYRMAAGSRFLLAFGAHAGLPLGNRLDGIANDHFMGAVYATLARFSAGMLWNGTVGTRTSLPWMEGHGETAQSADPLTGTDTSMHAHAAAGASGFHGMSLGNPHGNWELMYRGAVRREVGTDRLAVLVALEGLYVLSEPMGMRGGAVQAGADGAGNAAARNFITGEMALSVTLGATELTPHIRIPLSEAKRAGWGLGLRISERY